MDTHAMAARALSDTHSEAHRSRQILSQILTDVERAQQDGAMMDLYERMSANADDIESHFERFGIDRQDYQVET